MMTTPQSESTLPTSAHGVEDQPTSNGDTEPYCRVPDGPGTLYPERPKDKHSTRQQPPKEAEDTAVTTTAEVPVVASDEAAKREPPAISISGPETVTVAEPPSEKGRRATNQCEFECKRSPQSLPSIMHVEEHQEFLRRDGEHRGGATRSPKQNSAPDPTPQQDSGVRQILRSVTAVPRSGCWEEGDPTLHEGEQRQGRLLRQSGVRTIEAIESPGTPPEGTVGRPTLSSGRDVTTELADEQKNNPEVGELKKFLEQGSLPADSVKARKMALQQALFAVVDGVVYYIDPKRANRRRAVVPKSLRQYLLQQTHSGPFGAHFSGQRMFNTLATSWWWEHMFADVCRFAKACPECAITMGIGRKRRPRYIPYLYSGHFKSWELTSWTCL